MTAVPDFQIVVHLPDNAPVVSVRSQALAGKSPKTKAKKPKKDATDGEDDRPEEEDSQKQKTLEEILLADIRGACNVSKKYGFTIDKQSIIDDSTSLSYYISLTNDNAEKISKALGKESKPDQANVGVIPSIILDCVSKSPSEAEKDKQRTRIAQSTLQQGLKDLLKSRGEGVKASEMGNLSGLLSGFDALEDKKWAAKASTTVYTEAADLTEQQWENILFNNRILQGYVYSATKGMIKAPKRAFAIRRPEVHSTFDVERSGSEGISITAKVNPAGKNIVHEYLGTIPGIPRFYIEDTSRVRITEIKTALQEQLANQGFSAEATEINAAVEVLEAGGSFSARKEGEKSTDYKVNNTMTTSSLHVTYNFPRVVLELHPETLQLSDECLDDIRQITSITDVDAFHQKYGMIFATRLTLGGSLTNTRKILDSEKSKIEAIKKRDKRSGRGKYCSKEIQCVDRSAFVTWDAHGGDTVLCSDPPSWAYTVKDYRFWRVIEQSELMGMASLIGQVDVGAAYRLSNPKSSSDLDKHEDRNEIEVLISRMARIINGPPSDQALSEIIKCWDSENDIAKLNDWMSNKELEGVSFSLPKGKWNELDPTHKTFFAIYLQLAEKVRLIHV
ncbi:hypothetical protein N7513_003914 [Penicillium frequentans]|nr:hypothetical protein N7513_003914 [Penicillium glabrum]